MNIAVVMRNTLVKVSICGFEGGSLFALKEEYLPIVESRPVYGCFCGRNKVLHAIVPPSAQICGSFLL